MPLGPTITGAITQNAKFRSQRKAELTRAGAQEREKCVRIMSILRVYRHFSWATVCQRTAAMCPVSISTRAKKYENTACVFPLQAQIHLESAQRSEKNGILPCSGDIKFKCIRFSLNSLKKCLCARLFLCSLQIRRWLFGFSKLVIMWK